MRLLAFLLWSAIIGALASKIVLHEEVSWFVTLCIAGAALATVADGLILIHLVKKYRRRK
jgi:uncharacterized membrane protein YeaQ/YmgE (transglycosylase-associated protein family)